MFSIIEESYDPFKVSKGNKEFGYINVIDTPAAKFDMPVGVINGSLDGPTLTLIGGLYPTEYYGIEAASRLYQLIKPEELSGKLITIPIVNMSTRASRARRSTGSNGISYCKACGLLPCINKRDNNIDTDRSTI